MVKWQSIMKNRVLSKIVTGLLCLSVLVGIGGCTKPKSPTKEDVVAKVKEMIPEEIELVSKEGDKYTFRSTVRDITFEVEPNADTVNIDGSNFGYTGKFNYHNTYKESVYGSYRERVEQLMSNNTLSNVIPPVYNGVLIEILGETEDLIEEEG